MMTVFMLSLTGIPLTSGFIGKWMVFQATIEQGLVGLAIVGVVTSVASAFYYVRIIVNMFLKDGKGDAQQARHNASIGRSMSLPTGSARHFPFLMLNLANPITLAVIAP